MIKMSTQDAARALGVCARTLQHWVRTGEIAPPEVVAVGGLKAFLWSEDDVARARAFQARIHRHGWKRGANAEHGPARTE